MLDRYKDSDYTDDDLKSIALSVYEKITEAPRYWSMSYYHPGLRWSNVAKCVAWGIVHPLTQEENGHNSAQYEIFDFDGSPKESLPRAKRILDELKKKGKLPELDVKKSFIALENK